MSKLGLHVNAWVPGALDYVLRARPRHLKTMEANPTALRAIKSEIPDCFVVYRHYIDVEAQERLLEQPERGAREFASLVLAATDPVRQYVDAYEGLNETGLWDAADRYNLWTAEYGRMMRTEGCKTVAYNFSTGNPPLLEQWSHYLDGLRESDYLGLHEYGAPTMFSGEGWQCLRYRRVWDVLPENARRPILITECGVDAGVAGLPLNGWRWYGYSEEQYLEELRWYASEIERDSYVIGAHVFHAGSTDPRWDSFSVLGCEQIAEFIRNQGGESMPSEFSFAFGFKALHDANPEEIGEATSEQVDIPGAFSMQFTANGVLFYRDGAGAKFISQALPK